MSAPARRAWLAALLAAVALLATATPGLARATEESFTEHVFPAQEGVGPRRYWLYLPPGAPAHRPLVVVLHGCEQNARDVAVGSRFNTAARRRGLVVAYPEQLRNGGGLGDGNGIGCWNWFSPDHQQRGRGEPAAIAGITAEVVRTAHVDPTRVYVIGISAGADMAGILGATYPDRYAAVGMLAGCAYQTCADVAGTAAYAAMGPRARPVPAFIEQGSADVLNNVALGRTMVQQWVATDDWADDGQRNGSVSDRPASVESRGFDSAPPADAAGRADLCVRNFNYPCLSGATGGADYPTTIEHHTDAAGRPLVDFWLVHGLDHAWPNGDPAGTFTDPAGPDVTNAAVDFFLAHRLPRR